MNPGCPSPRLLPGKGDGTFAPAVHYSAGAGPNSVAVDDFNRDTKPDLIVVNYGSYDQASNTYSNRGISILLNQREGKFAPEIKWASAANPTSVATGDLDGDGALDVVLTTSSDSSYQDACLSVLISKADGRFATAIHCDLDEKPYFVTTGDLNRDGKLDLAVANSDNVSVLLGRGDGTFSAPFHYGTGRGGGTVAIEDFNGDGWNDLVVAKSGSEGVSVLLNLMGCAQVSLSLERGSGMATLAWPIASPGFVLESATSLAATNWQRAVETATTNSGRMEVPLSPSQKERYFRLRRP